MPLMEGTLTMTLPSQTARAGGSGRVYTSRRPFKIRLTPQLIALAVVGGVVVVALASWGLGGLGKKDDGPKNEPVDTSVRSEPVPEDRGLRLPGPSAANAGTPKGGSTLARQPATQTPPQAESGKSAPRESGSMAMLPPPKEHDGARPLVIEQGSGGARPAEIEGAGPLGRALSERGGAPTPTDPNVITALTPPPSTPPTSTPTPPHATTPTTNPTSGTGLTNPPGGTNPTQGEANPPPGTSVPAADPIAAPLSEHERSVRSAEEKIKAGDLVAARQMLSRALASAKTETERAPLRQRLSALNEDLVFSPKVYPGDTFVETYTVQSGDALAKIASKRDLATDWRLIQRVNRLSNPNRISVGQKLKLVRGPFHAVVTKSAYRLDLYMGSPDEPSSWVFVRSYTVGLGEDNGTPTGNFVVKKNSKLVNPYWVNPRTGEKFAADDPKNPIGEHWIGIEGVGESAPYVGYGLHGTIEPDSIGRQRSMGCVRMHSDDIAQMYELLVEGVSVVRIVP